MHTGVAKALCQFHRMTPATLLELCQKYLLLYVFKGSWSETSTAIDARIHSVADRW